MKIVFLMHVWAECIQNQASACKHIIAPILYFLDNVFFCPGNKKGSVILCMLWVHCLCGTVTSAVVCLKPFPMKQSQLKGYFLVTGDCPETFFVLNQFVLALNKPRSESSTGK